MKKEDIPQDKGAFPSEISYVVDEKGQYTTGISNGWEIKKIALDVAWSDVDKKIAEAKQKVLNGEVSPVYYFMQLKIMDLPIIAGYTGFWQWQIKRHFKPAVFEKLSTRKLQQYAELFETTVEELKGLRATLQKS